MTTNELADQLEAIRRKYRGLVEEAKQKKARILHVAEELSGLTGQDWITGLESENDLHSVRQSRHEEVRGLLREYFGD